MRLGTRVVGWDASSKTVTADDGGVTQYDKLVVAIGCTALRLPDAIGGGLPGVHYVRDNADALALSEAMATARAANGLALRTVLSAVIDDSGASLGAVLALRNSCI